MKRTVFFAMLILVMITLVSCGARKAANSSVEYFYRGFASINENAVDAYPHGTLVIQSDEDWHDFMDRYVPGIPYNVSVDYSKECLVFSSLFPAKPTYAQGADIKDFVINENRIEPEYIDGSNGISNGIYAQNMDGVEHCFVNIVKINRKDIPTKVENVYHKK